MASEVTICNTALAKLAQPAILALSDASRNARECARSYPEQLEILLRKHAWTFAIERRSLAKEAMTPAFGYSSAFKIPSTWIRILDVYPETNQYALEGGRVLINSDTLLARGIRRVTDPNEMPATFREVLSLAISVDICLSVTQNTELFERLKNDLRLALQEARGANAVELPYTSAVTDDWLNAREGWERL